MSNRETTSIGAPGGGRGWGGPNRRGDLVDPRATDLAAARGGTAERAAPGLPACAAARHGSATRPGSRGRWRAAARRGGCGAAAGAGRVPRVAALPVLAGGRGL